MKNEDAKPKRFIQEGILIYSSGTLHHQTNSIRGFLYKMATKKMFQKSSYYKRYYII